VSECGWQPHFKSYLVQHAFERVEDFGIPEPQHLVAMFPHAPTSFLVIRNGLAMLAAIEFHHQLRIVADKIRDISSNRNLPAEVPPFRLETPELLPEHTFRSRGIVAK
jgi:hypothetical protein